MLAIGKFLLEEIGVEKIHDYKNSDENNDENENENNDINSNENIASRNILEGIKIEQSEIQNQNSELNKFEWVENIVRDDRISFQYGDMAETGLESG